MRQGFPEGPLTLCQAEARTKVWRALQALGGRPLSQEMASGILIGVPQAFYGL